MSGVLQEAAGHVTYLTIDRPHALNAIDTDTKFALAEAVARFEADDDQRVLVLGGSDCGAFCVGSDLKGRAAAFDGDGEEPSPPYAETVARCTKPVVAAIDGYCVGGGLELALACDIRVASARSSFSLPEVRIGTLGSHGLDLLSRTIPLGEAMLLHLTGARMGAERAHQIGLVQGLAADRDGVEALVEGIVDDLLLGNPLAARTIKHVVTKGRDLPVTYAQLFSQPYRDAIHHGEDAAEGARAFRDKRPPRWAVRR